MLLLFVHSLTCQIEESLTNGLKNVGGRGEYQGLLPVKAYPVANLELNIPSSPRSTVRLCLMLQDEDVKSSA